MAKAKKKTTKKLAKKAVKKGKSAVKASAKKSLKKVAKRAAVVATTKKIVKPTKIGKTIQIAKAVKATAQPVVQVVAAPKAATATPKTLPNLELPATGGQTVKLSELAGKKVVLFFYPKDLTPGCTIEGHEFTKLQPEFTAHNALVYGVSRDTVALHEKFKAKECYTIDLLSDEKEALCNHFGVIKDKNMYGKMVKGIERSTFVVNEQGEIVKEWRGVKAEGHAQEVLNYLTQN